MFIVARVSVDVHVIGVVVLGVFGLSGPVLATVVVHVRRQGTCRSRLGGVDVHVVGVLVASSGVVVHEGLDESEGYLTGLVLASQQGSQMYGVQVMPRWNLAASTEASGLRLGDPTTSWPQGCTAKSSSGTTQHHVEPW